MAYTVEASMTLDRSILALAELAPAMMSAERLEHSLRVADTAREMCRRLGLDTQAGRALGLAHDLFKDKPEAEQYRWAARWNMDECPESVFEPRLAHGPAAAAFLLDRGILDRPELLEAVAWHTLGKPGMGPYTALLYAADKLEPGRGAWRSETRHKWLAGDYDGEGGMDRLLIELIEATLEHLRSKGWAVAPSTLILYNSLTGKNHRA